MKDRIRMIIMALLLCVCVFIPAVSLNAADENASSEINACMMKQYTDLEEVADYLAGKNTYPTEEGYLFAGWYTTNTIPDILANAETEEEEKEALKYAIRSDIPEGVESVYALFVPASVLDVKAQLSAGLLGGLDGNTKGSIRFVTTVNSLLYKEVGFEISYINSKGAKKSAVSSSNKVYEKLYAVGSTTEEYKENEKEYLPTEFCDASKYFKACNLNNVPASDFTVPFTIKPFWVTLDGSKVYGEAVIKSMDDYFLAEDVYVSTSETITNKKDEEGYGFSEEQPCVTLNYALSQVKNQGTIHVVESYATTADFVWDDHNKTVNITGGTIDFTTMPVITLEEAVEATDTTEAQAAKTAYALDMQDSVTFTDITLVFTGTDTQHIYANGNTLEIASDVVWGNSDTSKAAYIRVYGGAHNTALKSDTNLILAAGQYTRVIGGGNYSALTGDVNITLSGSINPNIDHTDHGSTYMVLGGGHNSSANVTGDVHITVASENVLFNRIYGGGHKRSVTGNVYIEFAGKAMGVYGGGFDGTITGDTYLTMTGGWAHQLFGGCEDVSMTGNTNIDVQGGTIQRRIYGGCYNGTSGTSFATTACVKGHSNVSIGANAEILLDYDNDNSIYAISRGGAEFTDDSGNLIEKGLFIFNENSEYKSKLGYNASGLDFSGLIFSDATHHYLITTNGNNESGTLGTVSPQSDYIRIKPHRGYSAVVKVGTTQAYYTESEAVFKLPELTGTTVKEITVTFGEIDSGVDKSSYEARIDGAYYDTFVEAMAAAPVLDSKETVTVTLLKDIEIAAQMSIATNIAIQNEPGEDITIYRDAGLNATDMFKVTSTGTLTLAGVEDRNSLVLDGRDSTEVDKSLADLTGSTGSLINNAGKLKIKNATLQYAKKTSESGGAVYSGGTRVEVENCIFQNNSAVASAGAIQVGAGILIAENSLFTANNAKNGGAIRAATATKITINKCEFGDDEKGNEASNDGGAFYNQSTNVTIVDTKFANNISSNRGGAVYNNAGVIVVKNSEFTGNVAITSGGAIQSASSGVLRLIASNDDKINSLAVFMNNESQGTADNNGGGAINVTNGTIEINGYRFENNQAKLYGGAVRVSGSSRTITGATFEGNFTTGAKGHGGAVYVYGENAAEITASTFKNNHTDGSEAHGGALYVNSETGVNAKVGILNTFTDNLVNGEGSKGNHIYVNVTSSSLIEEPENGAGTGNVKEETESGTDNENDENIEFNQ